MTYVDVFSGGVVNPTDTAYAAYTISANLTLVWPLENADSTNIAPAEIDINATVGGLSVDLPDATQVSVGQTVYLRNVGANAFNLRKSDSTLISSIATTTVYIVQLTDNATAAGTWAATAVGTSTPAVASALAGPGLTPYGINQLATAHAVDDISSTPYTVLTSDRASLLNWTGGAGTYDLPAAATAGDNFFLLVRNSGTGQLTVSSPDDIDDSASKVYAIGESSFIVCDGVTYYTVGYGQTDLGVDGYLSISVSGSGTYTLSPAEYAFNILDFTGALTGTRTIEFPADVGIWTVRNSTSGGFPFLMKVAGSPTTVSLSSGLSTIVNSTGSMLRNSVSDQSSVLKNQVFM